jgi:aspartyl protease family protein
MPFIHSRGGVLLHTLVWLVLLGAFGWFFYSYLDKDANPNRVPRVTGEGEVVLKRNRSGYYVASGAINGHTVTFLVDTGATDIAVPQQLAKKLDLERGLPVELATAAGPSRGYMTRLAMVELATLRLPNAGAIVAEGLDPDMVLLGMNFLRHVEMTQRRDELILKPLTTP